MTNEQYAPEDRMQFRIGMHSGEVVVDSDRIYGSGINIAARLERLARPGGVCISETVRGELERSPTLEDIGPQHVKNIPYPIHAFFVDVPGQELPARLRARSGPRSRCCRSRRPRETRMRSTSRTASPRIWCEAGDRRVSSR